MSLVELKKALKEKDLVFGYEKTLKNLMNDKTKRVFLASNCPIDIKEKIKSFKVEIIELKEPNDEIALICKKPYSISVISY